MDCRQALEILETGNRIYCKSKTNDSVIDGNVRRNLVENGQHPIACVICCSDSRVVPEHIFNTGLGSLFTIRTAGNVVGPLELGSVEYAVCHLHTPLVVVMGHTHCGAVAAALEGHAEGMIQSIAGKIQQGIGDEKDARICEHLNAQKGMEYILNSPLIWEQIDMGAARVISAVYDTESGAVTFDK